MAKPANAGDLKSLVYDFWVQVPVRAQRPISSEVEHLTFKHWYAIMDNAKISKHDLYCVLYY